MSRPRPRRPLTDASLPAGPAVLVIRRPGYRWGHFVAWDGAGRVFDPEDSGPVPLLDYRRAGWHLIVVIRPAADPAA
jgi:hypothetical protein